MGMQAMAGIEEARYCWAEHKKSGRVNPCVLPSCPEPSAHKVRTDLEPHSALGPGRAGATGGSLRRALALRNMQGGFGG